MMRSWLALALGVAFTTLSCNLGPETAEASIADRSGRLFVDGVPTDYYRELTVQGTLEPGTSLTLTTASGLVDLVGVPGTSYELVVDYYTELQDDGTVVVENGELKTLSDFGGQTLINGIRGRVPEGTSVRVHSGTGEIVLSSFMGRGQLDVDAGTGSVRVVASDLDQLAISSATGDVHLEDIRAEQMKLRSVTGALMARNCEFRRVAGDTGTGNFAFQACRIDNGLFQSGAGDLALVDSVVSELRTNLGTGNILRD